MKKEIKEKVMKIMNLALELNSKRGNTIFVQYFGHTNEICAQVYEKGWEYWRENGEGRKKLNESYLYLDKDDCVEKLNSLIKKLEEMKG